MGYCFYPYRLTPTLCVDVEQLFHPRYSYQRASTNQSLADKEDQITTSEEPYDGWHAPPPAPRSRPTYAQNHAIQLQALLEKHCLRFSSPLAIFEYAKTDFILGVVDLEQNLP